MANEKELPLEAELDASHAECPSSGFRSRNALEPSPAAANSIR